MTTHDTPEAALAAAIDGCGYWYDLRGTGSSIGFAAAILAAMLGWTINRIEVVPGLERIVRDQEAGLKLARKTIEWTRNFVVDEAGAQETWERGTRAALALAPSEPVKPKRERIDWSDVVMDEGDEAP